MHTHPSEWRSVVSVCADTSWPALRLLENRETSCDVSLHRTHARLQLTVDEFQVGDRVTVEVHAGCGRCQRCREGMYTSCLNYGYRAKGHRANGFSTDGGFAEYAVNNINTLAHIPESRSGKSAKASASLALWVWW